MDYTRAEKALEFGAHVVFTLSAIAEIGYNFYNLFQEGDITLTQSLSMSCNVSLAWVGSIYFHNLLENRRDQNNYTKEFTMLAMLNKILFVLSTQHIELTIPFAIMIAVINAITLISIQLHRNDEAEVENEMVLAP